MRYRVSVNKSAFGSNAPSASAPGASPASVSVPGGGSAGIGTPVAVIPSLGQTVLTVGAAGEFKTIGAAVAAATNGDLILIQPGTYVNDFADVTAQVTIAGAGGIVNLVATEAPPNEKGIFVVDASCTIENLSFQGAAIPDSEGGNAAGIRDQGGNLVLNNDSFIGNQNGILAAAVDNLPQNTVTITNSTFDSNGQSSGPNAGYTHNAYISTGITSLVAEHDIFERANEGHELKSRAASNLISGNIFYDGPTGTASYSIDLPDGGTDTVSGNVIEKGPDAANQAVIHFGGEGIPYGGSTLLVTSNQFINDLGPQAVGVLNQSTLNVQITGNEFDNFVAGNIGSGVYTENGNWDQNGNAIAPSASNTFAPGTDVDDFSGDALTHTVTLTQSMGVRGGGGLLTVFADAGHVTVLGGSGGLDYVEQPGWGGSYIATSAGAADTVVALGQDVVDSEGNDTITGGSGNLFVQVNGQASISGASNDNAYVVDGAASITGAGGSDTVQLNADTASAVVTGAEAYLQTTVNGGAISYNITQGGAGEQVSITGGGVAAEVYNGGSNITTAGGTGGALIDFGAGTVTALFSNGSDTIYAGSGSANVIVTANAQVHAGSGTLAVFGRGETGTATVYGAAGTVAIGGDSGGILYVGGAAANTVQASLSNIVLTGGAGLMSVAGGSNQTISGGTGGIIFSTAGGADVITTAQGAHDTLNVAGACIITSNGTDTINAGSGNSAITANGAASITGSTGNAFYMLNGQDSLAAYGYSRITVGAAAADTVTNYGSIVSVSSAGGRLAFSQMANTDHEAATISGAGATLTSYATGNITCITLTAKGSRATLGGGHDSISCDANTSLTAGGGHDTASLYGGGVLVHGGAGSLTLNMNDWADQKITTVFGGAGAITETAGYGNLIFAGGSGSACLAGVSGGETVAAGAGNITLGGGGAGTIFAAYAGHGASHATVNLTPAGGHVQFGGGTTTITEAAYGQAVIYDFAAGSGGGADIINGFRAGTDALVFQGVSVASQVASGGSTMLVLSDGTQVTLVGVGLSQTSGLHLPIGH
jgi:hypothetical protein